MSQRRNLKQRIKHLIGRIGAIPRIQQYALRLVYLSRFNAWMRDHPCPEYPDSYAMYAGAASRLPQDRPINYLEFGVYRGDSLRWWVDHHAHPDSLFAGFDTFTGLPEDWSAAMPKGTFSTGGKLPDIRDARVAFQVGLFQDTLGAFVDRVDWSRPTVVHCDADLYSSTLYVLLTVVPRLKPGDVVIFDEFHDYLDEFRALEGLLAAYPVTYEAIGRNQGYTRVALRLT